MNAWAGQLGKLGILTTGLECRNVFDIEYARASRENRNQALAQRFLRTHREPKVLIKLFQKFIAEGIS